MSSSSDDMITVCFTATNKYFVKKRKIQKVSKHQTVRQLYELAASAFGMKRCTLRHGYPPVDISSDAETMELTLVTAGIQDQDLITVIEEKTHSVGSASKTTANAAALSSSTSGPAKTSAPAHDVIELLDGDSDSDSDSDTNQKPRPSKRARKHADKEATAKPKAVETTRDPVTHRQDVTEAPIKLFATRQDLQLRQQTNRSHWSWSQCKTLREMLLSEGNNDIQFLVISNFLIDFGYLLQQVPELLFVPHVVVFYGSANPSIWKSALAGGSSQQVDFIELNPKADPKTAINPLKYKFFGCHHTKLFLIGHSDEIRVVVHTANIGEADTGLKANVAYMEDFPLANNGDSKEPNNNDFETTLLHYVDSYGYTKKRNWLGQQSELLVDALHRYDYSSAKAILVPSIPGYHRLPGEHRMGHLKLRHAIAQHTPDTRAHRPTVCQFSSIGNLSKKTLLEFQTSMDCSLARREEDDVQELQLKLVWPTADEIGRSVEGYAGGSSVPGKTKSINKPFLKPLMHRWSADEEDDCNPLSKSKNVPHIKSYYQCNADGSMDWLFIGSQNLSAAAWGQIRKDKPPRESYHHYVSSWELGVFLSPEILGAEKLVHWRNIEESPGTVTVPLPYKMSPDAYSAQDEPWAVDGLFPKPDRFGFTAA